MSPTLFPTYKKVGSSTPPTVLFTELLSIPYPSRIHHDIPVLVLLSQIPFRGRVRMVDPDWVNRVYTTQFKEPFYKGTGHTHMHPSRPLLPVRLLSYPSSTFSTLSPYPRCPLSRRPHKGAGAVVDRPSAVPLHPVQGRPCSTGATACNGRGT